ncbi:hypothetical protein ACQKWADRAFT_297582 [Trichoderma austrokoningii]
MGEFHFHTYHHQGNKCWCGSFIGGQTTWNQTKCNSPCGGNKQEMCGGKERINVFEPVIVPFTSSKTAIATSSATTITTSKQSSGAVKNRGIF